MKQSFVFLAQGFEEVEALTVVDVLRRAGIPVKTVSITGSLQVTGAHGISVKADVLYDSTLFDAPEWLILPGGMPGSEHLYNFAPLQGLLERQVKGERGRVAAICAAPAVVLGQLGLLKDAKATCYPGFEELLQGAKYIDSPVVVDGKFITSSGPANALPWALTIVRETVGSRQSSQVAGGMLAYPPECSTVDFG